MKNVVVTIGDVILNDNVREENHVYYFQKEIGEEDFNFEISQLELFYEHGVVYREGIRGFEYIW